MSFSYELVLNSPFYGARDVKLGYQHCETEGVKLCYVAAEQRLKSGKNVKQKHRFLIRIRKSKLYRNVIES
ncbi:hypothetical protein HanIR_Chr09g0444081 [Helianthus annuus]|nr:hypothetical protein HanIR_Chr09g0444081 [Helianthus annuus]